MNNSFKLEQSVFEDVENQIKKQKKILLKFPLFMIIMLFLGYCRNGLKMPGIDFYIIGIPCYFAFVYAPIKMGLFLGKIFYSIEKADNEQVRLTTFGALWRKEKVINVDLKDIKIDKIPLPKLLYQKYSLNNIYIEGEKYRIFTSLLKESGMIE